MFEPGIDQLTGTGHGHRHSAHRADHPDGTAARRGCQNQGRTARRLDTSGRRQNVLEGAVAETLMGLSADGD